MDIKKMGQAMEGIEFALHRTKNQDSLSFHEVAKAHKDAQQIMTSVLKPLGAFAEVGEINGLTSYQALLHVGMKESELDHWGSDLYVLKNDLSTAWVDDYEYKVNVTKFVSQIDGEWWYEIPFAYMPEYIASRHRTPIDKIGNDFNFYALKFWAYVYGHEYISSPELGYLTNSLMLKKYNLVPYFKAGRGNDTQLNEVLAIYCKENGLMFSNSLFSAVISEREKMEKSLKITGGIKVEEIEETHEKIKHYYESCC